LPRDESEGAKPGAVRRTRGECGGKAYPRQEQKKERKKENDPTYLTVRGIAHMGEREERCQKKVPIVLRKQSKKGEKLAQRRNLYFD